MNIYFDLIASTLKGISYHLDLDQTIAVYGNGWILSDWLTVLEYK